MEETPRIVYVVHIHSHPPPRFNVRAISRWPSRCGGGGNDRSGRRAARGPGDGTAAAEATWAIGKAAKLDGEWRMDTWNLD